MKTRKDRRPAVLYHVTFTRNVPRIRKRGILRFQAPNWAQGLSDVRYGDGEVFAFEKVSDAIRWAAKMDWDFHQTFGSGKISIVEFLASGTWSADLSDPLGQVEAKGRWLKSLEAVKPSQIVSVSGVDQETIKRTIKRTASR